MESRGAPSTRASGTPAGLSDTSHFKRVGSGLARLWERESDEGLSEVTGFLFGDIIHTDD